MLNPGEQRRFAERGRGPAEVGVDLEARRLDLLGLRWNPFPMAPDPASYCSSPATEELLIEILHVVDGRKGFAVLTGEVGLGKTTLSRRLLQELEQRGVQTSLIFNTFLEGDDLLREINRDFGIDIEEPGFRPQLAALSGFLLQQRRARCNCAIVIDDAQHLSVTSLELIRQISNLEADADKLVQIILIGQPELNETLARKELRQLASRIVLRRTVEPFDQESTERYISLRIEDASRDGRLHMAPEAFEAIHAFTEGVPRQINLLMDRCLYAAIAQDSYVINDTVVDEAIADLTNRKTVTRVTRRSTPGRPRLGRLSGSRYVLHALIAVLTVGVVALVGYETRMSPGKVIDAAAAHWPSVRPVLVAAFEARPRTGSDDADAPGEAGGDGLALSAGAPARERNTWPF